MNMESETRDGYLVSDRIKRVWRTQIRILEKLDAVCKENGLRYYADFGTLLGAVRHKGFVPWDDDIDVTMPRPDYARLCEIGSEAFSEPYFFQNYHTEPVLLTTFSRIRDSRTAMIALPVADYPGYRGILRKVLMEKYEPQIGIDALLDLAEMSKEMRLRTFEEFLLSNYDHSDAVNVFPKVYRYQPCRKLWYEEVIMLPFEDIMIPAPSGYDHLLKNYYGDYMKPVMFASEHCVEIFDPDKSYSEYA